METFRNHILERSEESKKGCKEVEKAERGKWREVEEREARMWTSAGGDNCRRRNESWVEDAVGGGREGEETVEVAGGGSEAGRGESGGRGLLREVGRAAGRG